MHIDKVLAAASVAQSILMIQPCQGRNTRKESSSADKPNVLFIFVDDLRRELGAYGCQTKTPNIDALARQGSLFTHQFVSAPTSGASRFGMLTGMYPVTPEQANNEACRLYISGKQESEHPETLFHHMRRNGYYTVGIGKISHYVDGYIYGYEEPVSDKPELPYSWDEMLFNPGKWGTGWNAFFGYADGQNRQSMNKKVKPYESFDGDDSSYPDGLTAELAVDKLKELAASKKPFCLAVGFFKPHLPFNSPKKYWDMYNEDEIELSPQTGLPAGMSKALLHNSAEFNGYRLGEEHPSLSVRASDDYARKLRHAYFAAVSYSDAQVGKVLDALKESGLSDNTIVILWGDHGWHLGDQMIWGKHTVLETSSSSAFIVCAPGHKSGIVNDRIISSVDIYPTLMDLCGIPCPEGLDGHSFVKLLDRPKYKGWKDIAFTYYRGMMSMRVPKYRMAAYNINGKMTTELYEYGPDRIEHKNIAEQEPDVASKLLPLFQAGITPAFK